MTLVTQIPLSFPYVSTVIKKKEYKGGRIGGSVTSVTPVTRDGAAYWRAPAENALRLEGLG